MSNKASSSVSSNNEGVKNVKRPLPNDFDDEPNTKKFNLISGREEILNVESLDRNDPDNNQNKEEDLIEIDNDAENCNLDELNNLVSQVQSQGSQNLDSTKLLKNLFENKVNFNERMQTFFKYKLIEFLTNKGSRGKERCETIAAFAAVKSTYHKLFHLFRDMHDVADMAHDFYMQENSNIQNPQKVLRNVSIQTDLIQSSPLKQFDPPSASSSNSKKVETLQKILF